MHSQLRNTDTRAMNTPTPGRQASCVFAGSPFSQTTKPPIAEKEISWPKNSCASPKYD